MIFSYCVEKDLGEENITYESIYTDLFLVF